MERIPTIWTLLDKSWAKRQHEYDNFAQKLIFRPNSAACNVSSPNLHHFSPPMIAVTSLVGRLQSALPVRQDHLHVRSRVSQLIIVVEEGLNGRAQAMRRDRIFGPVSFMDLRNRRVR